MGVKQTAALNAVTVCHKMYHPQMAADAVTFVKTRIKESLDQKEIVKMTMRKKIKNVKSYSSRKKVLCVGFQVLVHKINIKDPFIVKYIELLPLK